MSLKLTYKDVLVMISYFYMGTATHYLAQTAKLLNIPFSFVDLDESVLVLHFPQKDHVVINTKLGLITNAEEILGLDKAYQYQFLENKIALPQFRSYLDIHSKYGKFARFHSAEEIKQDILRSFSFPIVIKKNRGTEGENVFLVENETELTKAIAQVFNRQDWNYDYVLIAQKYIQPVKEYRAIVYHQQLEFAYSKDNSQAVLRGNLSPLHWERAQAPEVTDQQKIDQLDEFCQQFLKAWPLHFGGLDIIEDQTGKLWLIEVNTAPSLAFYIKDNGPEKVVGLYTKIIKDLQEKYA